MEKELILAAQMNNKRAMEMLFTSSQRRIYLTAYSFLHNVDEAKDTVQEVFLRIYENIQKFDTSKNFFPWAYRITKNICLNRLQLKENKNQSLPDWEIVSAKTKDPSAIYQQTEEIKKIKEAVSRLDGPHREIIILKYFEEHSYKEMAEILDISIGTVMSRLFNARKKLSKLLENDFD